jgi:3-phenylpropionate/trans-cinnamate dioxygenase ferredoxin reductase component
MPDYKYLIIGGGMAADAAVQAIREADARGSIGLISTEPDPPYNRPPLSKGLWKGDSLENIWRKTADAGAQLHLGHTAADLDPGSKRVTDQQGTVYSFDKLLLATGGTPRRLPFGNDRIIYFRSLADYRRLRALSGEGRSFAVIGGGFIGSEVAAALAMNGRQVTMIFPEETIGGRVFPRDLGLFVNEYYAGKGVEVLAGQAVIGVEAHGDGASVRIRGAGDSGEREILADGVIAGIGIVPDVALARGAGFDVDNGIVVNEFTRIAHPDIYAAGDVASFHNPALGRRIRVEHEDNANTMGRVAGRNMAGGSERYNHLPFFYSDLFELGYEAVGDLDSRSETLADWQEPNRTGVVYYLDKGRVRGVLLWNVWEQVPAARRLIAEAGPFKANDLKGRLPESR